MDPDGGQRRVELVGEGYVVVADHRDILPHGQPSILEHVVAADGDEIVGGDHGGEPQSLVEQAAEGDRSRFFENHAASTISSGSTSNPAFCIQTLKLW